MIKKAMCITNVEGCHELIVSESNSVCLRTKEKGKSDEMLLCLATSRTLFPGARCCLTSVM